MKPRLVQIAAGCTPGDAITGEVGLLHDHFKELIERGVIEDSLIYAEHIALGNSFRVDYVERYRPEPRDIILLHYGIEMETTKKFVDWPGRRVLVFHNITPSFFFQPYNLRVAAKLDRGRRDLGLLVGSVEAVIADSRLNAKELMGLGFRDIRLKPVLFQTNRSGEKKQRSCPVDLRGIIPSDESPVVLFVGRIVPNKNYVDLIKVLYFMVQEQPSVRLVLAGPFFPGLDAYVEELRKTIRALDLEKSVFFTGFLPEGHLTYLYDRANLFLTTSQHEGYCVPVMEAMDSGVPVLAYWNENSAVEETMARAGCGFRMMDHERVAQLALLLLEDSDLRKRVISEQFERMRNYSREKILQSLDEALFTKETLRAGAGV